jgi:hypothetical protein
VCARALYVDSRKCRRIDNVMTENPSRNTSLSLSLSLSLSRSLALRTIISRYILKWKHDYMATGWSCLQKIGAKSTRPSWLSSIWLKTQSWSCSCVCVCVRACIRLYTHNIIHTQICRALYNPPKPAGLVCMYMSNFSDDHTSWQQHFFPVSCTSSNPITTPTQSDRERHTHRHIDTQTEREMERERETRYKTRLLALAILQVPL